MEDKVGFDSKYLHINLLTKNHAKIMSSPSIQIKSKKARRCAIFLVQLFHIATLLFNFGRCSINMESSLVFMTGEKTNKINNSLPAFDIIIRWHLLKPA